VRRWLLPGATVAVFTAVVIVGMHTLRPSGPSDRGVRVRRGEVTVAQAINVAGDRPLTARGWVFNDADFGLRLCDGYRPGHPPSCVGPFVDLYNVDRGSFSLKSGRDAGGRPVVWGDRPVAVYGTLVGTAFTVQSVLG
jgi:hypothetical protein